MANSHNRPDPDDIPRIRISPDTEDYRGTEALADPIPKTVVIPDDEQPSAESSAASDSFAGPTLASQYEIIEKIGDGGMGVVYLGRDRKLGRFVAVKRLHRSAMVRPSLKERFFREAKAIAALSHIHIVHVYALGEDHHGPFIVMEYVPGPPEASPNKTPPSPFTLADLVHREGALTVTHALDLILKLCSAVAYAHSCGVIHRDLKPSNVLLNQSREPKIVDFGLARCASLGDEHLTVPGERMLSLGYGAPEQESDASTTDERADVYGLGGLLYFSITGKNPRYFRESDVAETLRVPIVKALEIDRTRRWGSVKEFMQALQMVKSPSAVELPTVRTTWRCKWCDTVNPVGLQFCGTCGWDGGERCAECGANTRFGIQYCGECGADAREYEMARLLRERLEHHWERKDYPAIVQYADRISSFKPAGPAGRRLVEAIQHLQERAQKALARIGWLRSEIPKEMEAEQFEGARALIEEHNALARESAFGEEIKRLPELILQKDMARARQLIAEQKWVYAAQLCRGILQRTGPGDADVRYLMSALRAHRRRVRVRNAGFMLVLLFFAYAFSAAPIYRLTRASGTAAYDALYGFVTYLHDATILKESLESYAGLWDARDMFRQRDRTTASAGPSRRIPVALSADEETRLSAMREEYRKAIDQIETDAQKSIDAWPGQYAAALRDLQENIRKQGDFDGWSAIQVELDRFATDAAIPEESLVVQPGLLRNLQLRFKNDRLQLAHTRSQRIVTATQQYTQKLKKMEKDYTIQGKMDAAALVNSEIKRVQANPKVTQAEQDLAPPPKPDAGGTAAGRP